MSKEEDPEIEYSALCGKVSRDGTTVRVEIYRIAEGSEGWSLEVIDEEGASTVWDDLFATDGLRIDKANLAGASIINSRLQGMTIDGIEVKALRAATVQECVRLIVCDRSMAVDH
jgi:hypothetical protein